MKSGVLNILKPPGMTSHDVVGWGRRVAGTRRVGHTGTLDPAAAGVLPICIGHATRLVEYLQSGTKEYIAEATFGFETDTLDAEGETLFTSDAGHVNQSTLHAVLERFRGEIVQTPPLYSAIKKDGQKLYELAREGRTDIEIPTRTVQILQLSISRFMEGDQSTLPRAILHLECSGGTYVRSLVRDIAHALNTHATMTFLVRTRSGNFTIDNAHTLENVQAGYESTLIPIHDVLPRCADATIVDAQATHNLAQGRWIEPQNFDESAQNASRVLFWNDERSTAVLAIRSEKPSLWKPEKVFFLSDGE